MPVPAQIAVLNASGSSVNVNAPLAPGRALAAESRPVALSNEDNATIGALTETAPGTDTASSGLNGRLQRIAQRFTSLIALVPASLGTKTAANSLAVTLASDGQFVTSIGAPADTSATTDTGTFSLIALFKRALGYLSTIATAAADAVTPSPIKVVGNDEWETVAASATTQTLGATGATGDRLSHVLIIPATTSPGAVSIKDGAGSAITIFTGGASSVTTLIPFAVPLGLKSLAGAWQITTGANVSAIGVGDFT